MCANLDLRQSPEYHALLRQNGCIVDDLGGGHSSYAFRMKIFPLFTVMIIQCVTDLKVLDIAERLSRRRRSLFVKIAPKAILGTEEAANWEKALNEYGYRWDKAAVIPTKTLVVDLRQSDESLLKQMKAKTRYNIRLAQRRGVTIRIVNGHEILNNPSDLDGFLTVFCDNCKRIGMKGIPRKSLERILHNYQENFFVVYANLKNGELGAVASYVVAGKTFYYQMNGSTDEGRRNFATNLTVWEGMMEGKRRDCEWLDFDGIADDRYNDEDWKGFSRYKLGFGGTEVTYLGSYVKWFPFLKHSKQR